MQIPGTVVFATAKGGAGKTSLSTHLAGCWAREGERVLLLDLDHQGNATRQFGIDGDEHGQGAQLVKALMFGDPLKVVEARKNLDVIVGGLRTRDALVLLTNHGPQAAAERYSEMLASVIDRYDWVVIDTPPAGRDILTDVAIRLSQYLVIPYTPKGFQEDALVNMAELLASLQSDVTLLGVTLWGTKTPKAVAKGMQTISEIVAGVSEAFTTVIPEADAAFTRAYDERVLVTELAEWAASLDFKERRFQYDVPANLPKVAAAMWDWAGEVRDRIDALEQQHALATAKDAR